MERSRRRRGGALAPLEPPAASLINRYRADLDFTAAQWDDQSPSGRHLVKVVVANDPVFVASGGPNDAPYITFDGTILLGARMRVTYAQTQPEFVRCIAKPSRSAAANKDLFDGATGNTRRLFTAGTGFGGQCGAFAGAQLTDTSTQLDAWHKFTIWYNGASSYYKVDERAAVMGDLGAASSGGLIVGAFGDTVSNIADCDIAEILIYGAEQTGAALAELNAYTLERYGL